LPARPSRRGGDGRGDGRAAIGRLRRGREPAPRAEGCPGLVPGRSGGSLMEQTQPFDPGAVGAAGDDAVLPFAVEGLDVRGRAIQMGPALSSVLARHDDYPLPVSKLLGEAIVLAVLLGSSLKFDGQFLLQTQTDGPVDMLVVDFRTPGDIRAYARF